MKKLIVWSLVISMCACLLTACGNGQERSSGNYTDENSVWGVAEGTIGAVYVTHDSPNPRSERLSDDDIAQLKQIAEDIRTGALDLTNYPTEEEYFAN